ncbi:Mth938-like domain-containing protein [Roseospira visakhapatnamensis]|uniref:Mth938-like domain-containing protein n=1 Tax=Roseospira visakhapatnamensis TaxID=390880 RepID=A0A7W6RF03_9PROT|nr:MTH938/NDUFAF3 family protein [Roseospira visakhapatnamensis]MBB4266819.1 uncharacterized protein [Roseospira visakhapatnamensis]
MEITPLVAADRPLIQAYGDGAFRIQGRQHAGSLILLPDQIVPWSGDLTAEGLAPVLAVADAVEILIIGCGATMTQVPPDLRRVLRDHGIVPEPMDTGAGCRTWNVLLVEDRRVAAALTAL